VVERSGYTKADTTRKRGNDKIGGAGGVHDQGEDINKTGGGHWETKTLGWRKTCFCKTDEVRPCVVLDPFIGSGTTALVALEHGRYSWGIDLSESYLNDHARPRIEGALLNSGKGHLALDGVKDLRGITAG
jgi:hypothetical protein